MAGMTPAIAEIDCRARMLLHRRNDGAETHFLGETMRGLHLLLVEGLDERPRSSNQPVDSPPVEPNLPPALAHATHHSVIRIAFLTAGELAQRGFDRRPIGFLCRRKMQRALDAGEIRARHA